MRIPESRNQPGATSLPGRATGEIIYFGDNPEPLYIPYDAIKTFVDPSVEFGLRFETQPEPGSDDDDAAPMAEMAEPEPKGPRAAAEVVSLDKFRK